MQSSLLIRPATTADRAAVWRIPEPTIRAGETYALPRDMSEADAIAYWMGPGREVFVAEEVAPLERITSAPTSAAAAPTLPIADTRRTLMFAVAASPASWRSTR